MSEMIERVARTLEPQAWAALGTGDTLAYKNRRVSSVRKARAVIEAMRAPTEEMIEAGVNAKRQNIIVYFDGTTVPRDNIQRAIYTEMLNAALSTPDNDKT